MMAEELDEAPPSLLDRLRAVLAVPARLLRALFLPDQGLPIEVNAGRSGAALLALVLCGLFGAMAVGARLDVSTQVLSEAAAASAPRPGATAGETPAAKSDREVAEDIDKTLALERVMSALSAGLWTPIKVLILAVVIYLLLLYIGGAPTMKRSLSAVSHAALPVAVKSLVLGIAALGQASVTPAQVSGLVANPLAAPLAGAGPLLARLGQGVDPFFLWSVVLLGFGMAPAAEISRKRAFIALGVVVLLFLLVTRIGCGGGGPPSPGPEGPR
jgi:hypothetical protein